MKRLDMENGSQIVFSESSSREALRSIQPGVSMMVIAREAPAIQFDSRLEAAWAQQLQMRVLAGDLHAWRYHAMRLRLADGTLYTPDFLAIRADREMEFHEVKGFQREAARVRINVAAELYPWFKFVLVRRGKGARGQWTCDEVRG